MKKKFTEAQIVFALRQAVTLSPFFGQLRGFLDDLDDRSVLGSNFY